jgi:hypothetical protein
MAGVEGWESTSLLVGRRNVSAGTSHRAEVRVRARSVIGVALCLVGALWFGQGVGWVGGSFMTGEAVWAVIGATAIVFGVILLRGPRRKRGAVNDD